MVLDTLINTYTEAKQVDPSVASLTNGSFVVTWSSLNQEIGYGSYGIYGQLYDYNGVSKKEEFHINSYTKGPQQYPSVTALRISGVLQNRCHAIMN